jgi:hypothetical protein
VTYQGYSSPKGFNFDITADDDPIVDDPEDELYNIEIKANNFVNYFRKM